MQPIVDLIEHPLPGGVTEQVVQHVLGLAAQRDARADRFPEAAQRERVSRRARAEAASRSRAWLA